ncbi:MAG: hypothetical protein K8U57_02160, partial [Planctomycetes bacterium]|nr:hypothetical protein [Planctomycetota bacterium]
MASSTFAGRSGWGVAALLIVLCAGGRAVGQIATPAPIPSQASPIIGGELPQATASPAPPMSPPRQSTPVPSGVARRTNPSSTDAATTLGDLVGLPIEQLPPITSATGPSVGVGNLGSSGMGGTSGTAPKWHEV